MNNNNDSGIIPGVSDGSSTPNADAKSRFAAALKAGAARITSVRNDVYTTKWWQMAINFVLGAGALACLIASMLTKDAVMTVTAVTGVALVVAVVVYNYVLRAITPSSFLQYSYKDKDREFRFMILSKTRAVFSDGNNTIESNRDMAAMIECPPFPQYRYDFFADMDAYERTADGEREVYKGVFECNGKSYKCKIVFKQNTPIYGTVGGARIKYFDVNYTKDKFVVPVTLKRAAKALNVPFPKLPGLYVRDDVKDLNKQ